MKTIHLTYLSALLGCFVSGAQAGDVRLGGELKSEVTQGLSDVEGLLGTSRQSLVSPQEMNMNGRLDGQTQIELNQLQAQANGPTSSPAQKARAGQAAWILGLIHLHGAGVPLNPAQAKQWFLRSAEYGHPMARAGLSWCAYDGCQTYPDFAEALTQAQSLMSVDRARALYMMWLIEEKMRPLHEVNPSVANEAPAAPSPLLQQAADGGNVHAMLEVGIFWVQKKVYSNALVWFERASSDSMAALANVQWVRKHLAQEQSARQTPSSNTLGQSSDALFSRARKYHRGEGTQVNYTEAVRLYREAEAAGSIKARKMLSLIFSRISPDGTMDLAWMRQLAEMDVAAIVPKQEESTESTLMQREPSPLMDLMPLKWRRWVRNQSVS